MENPRQVTWRSIAAGALAAALLFAAPSPADPPVDPPIPGTVLPRVFCFRITDIRADKTDPELNRFHFEFEILNWSDVDAGGLEMSLALPTPVDVMFAANSFAGVDTDGRPLFLEDTNGDMVVDAADNEDLNGNGMLDAGEDQNGNGRLDNDPIPGNLGFPNAWTQVSQTATKVVWAAPAFFPGALDGVPFVNLIGAAGFGGLADPDFANSCVPGVDEGTATVDVDGNVIPTEAIDDENNVLDGFVMTVDGLDAGESLNINWFLTGAGFGEESLLPFGCRLTDRFGIPVGDPIGTSFEGNEYGFGVITLARVDDGPLGGPVFEGNVGVGQGALEFFDSVYIVPDPAGMAAEFGAGLTAEFVDPADNTLGAGVNAVPVVQDADNDGVADSVDVCLGTAIPEEVPTRRLGNNRFALVDDDLEFDSGKSKAAFTIGDTGGCSCEQVIQALDLGKGHEKFGCSKSAMETWVGLVNP